MESLILSVTDRFACHCFEFLCRFSSFIRARSWLAFPSACCFVALFYCFVFFIKKSQEFLLLVWQSLSFAMGLSTHTSSFSFEMALCFVRFLLQKRVWWWYLTIIWCYSLKQILTLRLSLAVEYWGIVICDIEYP